MRVLFWSSVFWPKIGGVEIHAANLLPSLKARRYDYLVITTQVADDQADFEYFQGIPIYRLPFWRQSSYSDMDQLVQVRKKVMELKRDFAPNLVHINRIDPSIFFYHFTRSAAATPLIVTLHGEWPSNCDGLVTKTLRAADWVTGCSHAILETGRQLVPDISRRSSLIYNGIEPPPVLPGPLPFDAPRLLCLGRLAPEKGFELAVSAFAAIFRSFPRARLLIAGDGAERARLEQQAAQQGVRQHVDFLGWVKPRDVWSLINACTAVLMPSQNESLPLVALEAALMARPVIATRVGGLPEVVVHEHTGLLVEPDSAPALADALRFLLRHPALAIQMGRAARSRAQQMFSWQNHVESYDRLYRGLTAKLRIEKPALSLKEV